MNIEQDNKSMAIINQFIQSLSDKFPNEQETIKTSLLSAINSSPFFGRGEFVNELEPFVIIYALN